MKQLLLQVAIVSLFWTATVLAKGSAFEISVRERLEALEGVVGNFRDENKQLKATIDAQQRRILELERSFLEHIESYTQDSKRDRLWKIKHTNNVAASVKRNAAAPATNVVPQRRLEEAECSEPGGAQLVVNGTCSCDNLFVGGRNITSELDELHARAYVAKKYFLSRTGYWLQVNLPSVSYYASTCPSTQCIVNPSCMVATAGGLMYRQACTQDSVWNISQTSEDLYSLIYQGNVVLSDVFVKRLDSRQPIYVIENLDFECLIFGSSQTSTYAAFYSFARAGYLCGVDWVSQYDLVTGGPNYAQGMFQIVEPS